MGRAPATVGHMVMVSRQTDEKVVLKKDYILRVCPPFHSFPVHHSV